MSDHPQATCRTLRLASRMSIKLYSIKGRAVEMTCSPDIAGLLGAEVATGEHDGTFLLVRANIPQMWVWRLHPKALER